MGRKIVAIEPQEKLSSQKIFFYRFKKTQSRDEQKTFWSVFTSHRLTLHQHVGLVKF
jgi:hypothetical protein